MIENSELKKFDVFGVFSNQQLHKLSTIIEKEKYEQGKKVYLSKYRASRLFVVSKGMVSLRLFDSGEQIGLSFGTIESGEIFGGACFLQPQKHTLTAICLKDSELLVIEVTKLFDLFEKDYELGYKFMKKIAQIYFDRYKVAKNQIYQMAKTPTLVTALPG